MKIVYLTDQIYLHGGVEKVLSQKANYFANICGDEVTIITYSQQNKKPVYPYSDKIKMIDLGINYEIGRSYFHPVNLRKIPNHFQILKRTLRQLKPDFIITCSIGPDFYFIPFLLKHIPKIKEYHASRYLYHQNQTGSFKKRMLKKLDGLTEKKYNHLVVLNESERKFYLNNNISVIPNPAEITDSSVDLFSKKIIAAGRISPVKNFGELIEVFSRIAVHFPDWELHFFGEDYLTTRSQLEERIKEIGLQKQIKFKGVTTDLKKEMTNYSIYAMTSETECFPMVLLEALSVGMPVISYDCPTGPKHILKNGEDAFLVPHKNIDAFEIQLNKLMHNENLRHEMGKKGVENVQRFSLDKVMQQWQNLFKELKSPLKY